MKRRAFLPLVAMAPGAMLCRPVILCAEVSAAPKMAESAAAFLKSLGPDLAKTASIPFDSEERLNWHYVPKSRKGIALKAMNDGQKKAAFALLKSGLSDAGDKKAHLIIELEGILAILEGDADFRDIGAYYFTVFGTPGDAKGWGWRFEGHHISINITQVGERLFATPAFWGANPANVKDGKLKGVRTLAKEEDLARQLAQSLQAAGKAVVAGDKSPHEFHTRAKQRITPLAVEGVSYADMNAAQRALLDQLLAEYISNFSADIAAQETKRIQDAGKDGIHFVWYGGVKSGERHYYRVQGSSFLVEYVNYQNDANHIHTVWRSFENDYGLA